MTQGTFWRMKTNPRFFNCRITSSEQLLIRRFLSYLIWDLTWLCPERTETYGKGVDFLLERIIPLTFAFSPKSDRLLPCHGHFFKLHIQTTGAIHRDLVKVLVIFMFLEDRNRGLLLLQKWTYLLCTQKLNSSAWDCVWVITHQVGSFLPTPESQFPSPGWLWFDCFYWFVSQNFYFAFCRPWIICEK